MGPQGPQGEQGETTLRSVTTGAAGAPASRAASQYRPTFWVGCVAGLDLIGSDGNLGRDGGNETLLTYGVTVYSTRDVDVSCMAGLGSTNGSGSSFYPAVVPGAKTGACGASGDYPPIPVAGPNDVGFWAFEIVNGTGPVATYMDIDPGHPLNGYKHTFTQSECNSEALGDDLMWTQVTLADVFR